MEYHKNGILWHLYTIQESVLFKTRKAHFCLVSIMEFSIISSCLGKVKVSLPVLVDVQRLHENDKFRLQLLAVNLRYSACFEQGTS